MGRENYTMNWGHTLRVAVPFAVVDWLLARSLTVEGFAPSWLFVFAFLGLAVAGAAARRGVSWADTHAGFWIGAVGAAACDPMGPAIVWLSLIVTGPGMLLAPVFASGLRRDPETALPAGPALQASALLVLMLCLVVGVSVGQEDALPVVGMLLATGMPIAVLASTALTLVGERRAGAWLGAVASAAWLLVLAALLVAYPM